MHKIHAEDGGRSGRGCFPSFVVMVLLVAERPGGVSHQNPCFRAHWLRLPSTGAGDAVHLNCRCLDWPTTVRNFSVT